MQPVTVGQLLRIQKSGFVSLLVDLMCVTEAAFDSGYLVSTDHPDRDFPSPTDSSDDVSHLQSGPRDASVDAWDSTIHLLESIFAASSEFRGAQTLTDALNGDIVELAQTLGLVEELDAIPIANLVSGSSLAENMCSELTALCEQMSEAEQLIVHKRLLSETPMSIAAIAQTSKLSGARIRQLQKRIEQNLGSPDGPSATVAIIGALVRQQIGPVTTEDEFDDRVSAVFPQPGVYALANARDASDQPAFEPATVVALARYMLVEELDYSCENSVCLDNSAAAVVQDLQNAAQAIADETNLVDESELRKHLPNDDWSQYWSELLKRCGLYRLNGQLALRETAPTRVKAALLSIGRPATKEEISDLSGLQPARVSSHLSSLPGVVRADKIRWGLSEWVDDEYEGIPAEIIQRINEDGGSTRLNRLLDELPRLFKVSESSVRAYISSPAFRLEHGWVSVTDEPDIAIAKLADVVDGQDASGSSYWSFEVKERHLRGYSLTGVPPEIAIALGCSFGGTTSVSIRQPSQCSNISVTWRKTSFTGPEIGRFAEVLNEIKAGGGDSVYLVLHPEGDISFAARSRTLEESLLGSMSSQLSSSADDSSSIKHSMINTRHSQTGVRVAEPIKGSFTFASTGQSENGDSNFNPSTESPEGI